MGHGGQALLRLLSHRYRSYGRAECDMEAVGFDDVFASALAQLGMPPDRTHATADAIPDQWPLALRRLYAIAAVHPLSVDHHRLLSPSETWRSDQRLVFAEENQQVLIWAVGEDDPSDDPTVWQGQPQPGGSVVWYSEEMPVTEFMVEWWTWVATQRD